MWKNPLENAPLRILENGLDTPWRITSLLRTNCIYKILNWYILKESTKSDAITYYNHQQQLIKIINNQHNDKKLAKIKEYSADKGELTNYTKSKSTILNSNT